MYYKHNKNFYHDFILFLFYDYPNFMTRVEPPLSDVDSDVELDADTDKEDSDSGFGSGFDSGSNIEAVVELELASEDNCSLINSSALEPVELIGD